MRFSDESPDAILERQHTELYAAVPNKLGYLGYGSQRVSASYICTRGILSSRLVAITGLWTEKGHRGFRSGGTG